MITSHYNIAYSRRRYLKPMISDAEIRELAELETVCFPPPENYDFRTLRMYVSLNGAGLLRWHEPVGEGQRLVAFHMFDCIMGELITLDVHPDFQRRGIGARLLETSMRKLAEIGHRRATCQIAVGNEASLLLHKRYGFKATRRIKNYYGPGRDAFFMVAVLSKFQESAK